MGRRSPARADRFPKAKHDDQIDWTAQMLDSFTQTGSGPSSDEGIDQL
jgi:hypothetical protein